VDGGVVELDRLIGKQPCGDFVDSRGDWHRYEYWKDTESELSELGTAEAPAALTQHWIDTIAEAALSGDRPRHNTAVEYVRGAASSLSFAARTLGAERGLSLDPDDPRGPVELPGDALTGEDAGGLLIWCASAALCVAATLQPQFRIRPSIE
jgi:hypothetical protein